MFIMIDEFHELSCPGSDNITPKTDGRDWCVYGKHKRLFYLLNGNRYKLADLLSGLEKKDFYFDSEEDCHEEAAAYYIFHGVDYPYMDEWAGCGGVGIAKANNSGSQVMEFA